MADEPVGRDLKITIKNRREEPNRRRTTWSYCKSNSAPNRNDRVADADDRLIRLDS
jgi:hypothetical protein